MNIVVLAGGTSSERAVSIVTGTQVCQALREKGHQAILADVAAGWEREDWENPFAADYQLSRSVSYIEGWNDKIQDVCRNRREFFGPHILDICRKADIVFLALHGSNGEDGKIQAAFDLFGIRYTGTGSLGSAMAMDKGISRQILCQGGVPVPAGAVFDKKGGSHSLEGLGLGFPVVVKPCCGGSSIGVSIAYDQGEYEKALLDAFAWEDQVVVEEYVLGREFSVGVVDGEALPVIEIAPLKGFYDYKNKYEPGSAVETCPAEIPQEKADEMREYARQGHKLLKLDAYSRLDFMMRGDGRIYCLEANTLPGMTPTSLLPQEAAATGVDFPKLCEKLIEVSMKKYDDN
ncbi:MAG: D-alanine--D-alanine ligase [Lachnospiraceae bacterium]|jgi:D-alanine-D-alanine ligase|nr:D-alanine--D-alanine ligase [Lachnospiraceae bacterium]MCI9357528.1 D-alanine--D-alanine ligase [Lachnospiraceae bacterium]